MFSRGRMHSCETFWKIFQYLFLLHSEKVSIPELVFHSSDRVRKKKKRFNLPLYCLVLAEKKFCKTAYRSRQFPHTFMTFVWILNIYHGKVLASNSEKDIDIQYVTDWRWRHESRTTKTSSSLSFCHRFYPYSVNTRFEINQILVFVLNIVNWRRRRRRITRRFFQLLNRKMRWRHLSRNRISQS